PLINLPDFNEPDDVARLAEGYRLAREVAGQSAFRRLCDAPLPARLSDDDLHHRIRENWYSIPHVVGTCAMGRRPEDGAVVDESGRVHGTDGLYVVDASIMPTVPSGFTHLPTIMIAERLSERIRARS